MKWFDNEEFWIDFYPFMFPEEKLQEASEQSEQIISLLGLNKCNVLDLCCGPGRFSIEFAKRGFSVTGVDKTKFLLEKAKLNAQNHKVNIDFIQADMIEYIKRDTFDLVLNMFTSFGYFEEENDDLKVLKNIYANLKKDGQFLIDIMGKEVLARVFQPTISTEGKDGSVWVQRHEIADDWTRVKNEWIIIKEDLIKTHHLYLNIYSGRELKNLLYLAGFRKVQLYGDFDRSEYGINSKRLIAIATK